VNLYHLGFFDCKPQKLTLSILNLIYWRDITRLRRLRDFKAMLMLWEPRSWEVTENLLKAFCHQKS
jgi:hypothetical protein